MQSSVEAGFLAFTIPREGRLNFMYADLKNLITTGVGNLIDPIELALNLPWLKQDMKPASKVEIVAEWQKMKSLGKASEGWRAYAPHVTLRLTEQAIDRLVLEKLRQVDNQLKKRYPEFDAWPADAQMATISMAWAMGASFKFPKFDDYVKRQDFINAASECTINSSTPNASLSQRNIANKICFVNAARARMAGLDTTVLYYPKVLPNVPCPTCGRA